MFNVIKKSSEIVYGSNAFNVLLGNKSGSLLVDKSYESYIKNAVKGNPVVASALNFIIMNIYNTPIKLVMKGKNDDETEVFDHPILDIIKKPNKYQSGKDFWKLHYIYQYANGDVLVRKFTGADGLPMFMIQYYPGTYDIKFNDSPQAGQDLVKYVLTSTSETIPFDEAYLRKFVDPSDITGGLGKGASPLEPSATYIDLNNKYIGWNENVIKNSGKPSGAFVVKGKMDKAPLDRLKAEVEQMYQGSDNAGKIHVLSGPEAELKTFDERTDASWIQGFQLTAQKISISLGLDPGLVGDFANKTYSNFKEAVKKAYTDLILPLKQEELDFLNEYIVKDYNDKSKNSQKLELVIDENNVEALQKDFTEMIKSLKGATWLTEKQKQELSGVDSDEDRDIYLVPSSYMEVNKDGTIIDRTPPPLEVEEEVIVPDEETQKIIKKKALSQDVYKSLNTLKIQFEDDLKPKVSDFLSAQGKRIAASLVSSSEKAFSVEVTELLKEIDWKEEVKLLNDTLEPTLTTAFTTSSRDIASIFSFQSSSVEISSAKIREQILERSVFITETTQQKVANIIAKGLDEGKSIIAISNDIVEFVEDGKLNRAIVISNTEVGAAVNSGVYETYKNEGIEEHEYITAGDGSVRDTHAAMDGIIVEIGKPFPNGLKYPNEYGGPAKEVVNCRCITLPVEN